VGTGALESATGTMTDEMSIRAFVSSPGNGQTNNMLQAPRQTKCPSGHLSQVHLQ